VAPSDKPPKLVVDEKRLDVWGLVVAVEPKRLVIFESKKTRTARYFGKNLKIT